MGRNGTVVGLSQSAQMTGCRDLRDDLRLRVSVVTGDMWKLVPIQLVIDRVVKEGVSLQDSALVA